MESWPFSITDAIVISVLVISALLAYARGFVHEVLSIAGWIGAGFATIYGFPYVKPYTRDLIPIEIAADLAAGVIIFIVSLAVLSLLTRAVSHRVQSSALNPLDRSLGFLFGLARGAVVVCLVYIGVEWVMPPAEQPFWIRNAKTMPLIETGADWLRALLPDDVAAKAGRAADGVEEKARQFEESKKLLEGLTVKDPKAGDGADQEGYGERIRREMERLIESSQKQ